MIERVHGLKTNSQAYQIVHHAVDIALSESLYKGQQFLKEYCVKFELKYWEMCAIDYCFTQLLKQFKSIN